MGEEWERYKICIGKREGERDHLGDLGVDGKIIPNSIFKK
jgi:DNA-directed RNA polymerase subunit N (RpoN/RPB10)